MSKLLTVQEAADYLNCHEMTIRKMIRQRNIPFIRKKGIGLRLRISDIEQWLEEDLHEPKGSYSIAKEGHRQGFRGAAREEYGIELMER